MIPVEEELEAAVKDGRMTEKEARYWRRYVTMLKVAAGVLLIIMIIALMQIAKHGI